MSTVNKPQRTGRQFDALIIYLVFEWSAALFLTIATTLYVVYYTVGVGLDPFQVVLMGTIFETTIFLFEVPTGVIADVYSRRLSIILGFLLIGIGLLVGGLFPTLAAILISEIISGIGGTCISGATQAWITDEIGVERAGSVFMRAAQLKTAAVIVGTVIAVVLASIQLRLPFIVGGTLLIALGLFLSVVMPEKGFHRTPAAERNSWQSLVGKLRNGLRLINVQRILIPILLIEFIYAFHSEGFDHLWQIHLMSNFTLPGGGVITPVVWFGAMNVTVSLISIGLTEIVRRRLNLNEPDATSKALTGLYAVTALGIVVFAVTGNVVLAIMAYGIVATLRTAAKPVSDAWLNQHIPSDIRATMISLNSQTGAFGEILGGPPIGAISSLISVRAALAACGFVLSLTVPLFVTAKRAPKAVLIAKQVKSVEMS